MRKIVEQAELLRKMIKNQEKKIDNPALVLSMLSELDYFIENVEKEGDDT